MKKIALKATVLSLLFSLLATSSVFALDSNGTTLNTSNLNASNSNDAEIVAAYRPTENGLAPVSQSELETLKNLVATKKDNIPLSGAPSSNKSLIPPLNITPNNSSSDSTSLISYYQLYRQTGYIDQVPRNDLLERLTPYVVNGTQDNMTRTISFTAEDTWEHNISLTVEMLDQLSATLAAGYDKTYSYSDAITCTIRPGYKSWVAYIPLMHNSYGYFDLYRYDPSQYPVAQVISSTFTDIYYPCTVGGRLDGYFFIMTAAN